MSKDSICQGHIAYKRTPFYLQNDVILVELEKLDGGSLGFSLIQGEKGQSSALYICSITPGGIAAASNKLRIGDRLLQVNIDCREICLVQVTMLSYFECQFVLLLFLFIIV